MFNTYMDLDVVEVTATIDMLDFMSHQADFSDLCQYMVSGLMSDYDPWGACIGHCNGSGKMEILGSFGIGDGLLAQYESASCLGMPIDVGIFINGKQIDQNHPAVEEGSSATLFQIMNSHGPNILIVIESNSKLVGYVQLLLLQPSEMEGFDSKFSAIMRVCRAALLMFTTYSKSRVQIQDIYHQPSDHHPILNGSNHSNHSTNHNSQNGSVELTDRQLEILRCISLGMTNSSIARKIGYSDSTVRQETIAIYRKLGARDRIDAAHIGQANGLIYENLPAVK
jgi:DNA-binding NarL/FixJ family response regulator